MKRRVLVFVLSILLLLSGVAYSAESDKSKNDSGSGNRGFFLSLGYDQSYLNSKYYKKDGTSNGKHTGWMNGVDVEMRYETKKLWTRGLFEYSDANNIKITSPSGATNNNGHEEYYRYEVVIGYKVFNLENSTFIPYVGMGHIRKNVYSSSCWYRWEYVPIGLNYVYKFNKWSLGVDTTLQVPFGMEAHATNNAGNGSADIHSGIGFRAEVPITVDIYKPKTTDTFKIFGLLTPYYQYWQHDPSDTTTIGGVTGYFTENRSNVFGLKLGIGINF